MSNNLTKNDESWIKIFDKYRILEHIKEHGKFEISASEINKFREARLMTKFDYKSNLPLPFIDNKLSILPITRGRVLKLNLTKGYPPDESEIVNIMKSSNLYNVNKESTFVRRSSTIKEWVRWIIDLID